MTTPNWKPAKGTALLQARERRASRVAAEQKVMQAALRRDEHKCRVPRCEYASKKLPIDPAHKVHRGIGGDPRGTRTTLDTIIGLCRIHHGQYDQGVLVIEPLQEALGFNGPCAYYVPAEDGSRLVCIGVERVIGVSVERGV